MELLIILAAFLGFIIFSNKKRSKAAKQLESAVAVGAKVVMLGGIKGTVVSISDDSLVVETTPGTQIEFVKAAVRSAVAPVAKTTPKSTKVSADKKPVKAAPKSTATKKAAK
jgi:preprotein translocase subunit YajC